MRPAFTNLLETEQVTVTAGVPTIWIALMRHIEQGKLPLTSLKRILVGGSAMPESLIAKFDQEFGIEVRQAWGMTETVAIATMSCLNSRQAEMPAAARHAAMAKQGKSVFGVEIKVVDDSGCTHAPRRQVAGAGDGARAVDGVGLLQGRRTGAHRRLAANGRYRDHRCGGNHADQGSGQRPH